MSKEVVTSFIARILDDPPLQVVEDVASESHESHRLPDPYVLVVDGDQLRTPSGELVEDFMEMTSYLGEAEYMALQKISGDLFR